MTTTAKTVRDMVLENPSAPRVFEQLGIDYCCGGEKPFAEACAAANLDAGYVLTKLAAQQYTPGGPLATDWQKEPLTSLIEHIIGTHHVFIRSECPRLSELLAKVCKVHGKNHPELNQVRTVFGELAQELDAHLMKEERILFPYIVASEQQPKGQEDSSSCFGTVRNPVRMMMLEHDNAGGALRELRRLSNDYGLPADACISYQTLYRALQDFEADLHQHIHLENNILFPRAIELEQTHDRP